MDKKLTTEVMNLYADCLRKLYNEAGLIIPAEFNPSEEAERIVEAIRPKTTSLSSGYSFAGPSSMDYTLHAISLMEGEERTRCAKEIYSFLQRPQTIYPSKETNNG